jgi:hypothetical protein
MMGVMARMFQNNTANFITEGLMNIFYNQKTANKFQPINSLMVEWEIDVEFVKRVEFAAAPSGMVRLFRFMVLQSSREKRAALCRVPVTGRTVVPVTRAMGREGL